MKSPILALCARALAFVLGIALASPVSALERGTRLLIDDRALGDELIDSVENAVWAADGDVARKPVYVIYGTDCPISHALFERTRALSDKVQLRWIASSGPNAANVADRRDSASVGKSFTGNGGPLSDAGTAQRAASYNALIPDSVSYLLRDLDSSGKFAYPTVVYRTSRGVKVVSGTPANISALANEVLDQPGKAAITPAPRSMAALPVQLSRSHTMERWGPDDGNAIFRAAPYPKAAPVFDLDTEHTMEVTGIVADGGWIQTSFGGKKAYVHAPLAARMALLDYQAKPASGFVDIRQPVAVHEFPHMDSRTLKLATAGDRYRRVGIVVLEGSTWDQVAFYKDGTPGYIRR